MTAKQYLSQAYRLNERINSDLSELDRLRDLATSLSGVNYDGVRVSKTRSTEAPFEKTICKIIDAEQKINAEIDRLVDLKAKSARPSRSWPMWMNSSFSASGTSTITAGRRLRC